MRPLETAQGKGGSYDPRPLYFGAGVSSLRESASKLSSTGPAIRASLEQARHSGLMDAATGLFTRDLFASHIARLATAARARNRR